MKIKSKQLILFFTLFIGTFSLSQIGSYLIEKSIPVGVSIVLSPYLYFTHVRNFGGIFGLFQGHGWIFVLFSAVMMLGLIVYIIKGEKFTTLSYICFGFIIGGGFSNVFDRFIYGSVIDFIDVKGIPLWHFVFNTADVFIHVGIWPMLLGQLLNKEKK